VAVTARGAQPEWSVYEHDATVTATFEMFDGSLFVYNGTWNARGLPTYWNSEWRIGAQQGSATWDGKCAPVRGTEAERAPAGLRRRVAAGTGEEPVQIAAALTECVTALREGRTRMCEVRENLLSCAMVEAAGAPVERGERVEIDELLEQARLEAIAAEADPAARELMQSWSSVREALTALASPSPRPRPTTPPDRASPPLPPVPALPL